MFKWVRRKLSELFQRVGTAESYEIYKPSERMIYRYWDGKGMVAADPIKLYKGVMNVGAELGADMRHAASPMKGAASSHEKMLAKIRGIFGVKPFEEGGLTELETIDLFDHFMVYAQLVKKNGSPTPTASTATSTTTGGSTSPGPEGPPATTPSSGSGSTDPGPGSDTPGPSPSGPASPSDPSSQGSSTSSPLPTETARQD